MKTDTFYFSHDYNARNDRKVIKLRLRLKMEGVGVYWSLIEMLYEEGGQIPFSEIPFIAEELRVKEGVIDQVLTAFDLFDNDGKVFWSNSVKRRLEKRLEKSEKAKESATQRWKNANALRTQSEGNAIKESKGNKSKGNDETPPPMNEKYKHELLEDAGYFHTIGMAWGINTVQFEKMIDGYEANLSAQSKVHPNYGEYKKHFHNWGAKCYPDYKAAPAVKTVNGIVRKSANEYI